MPSATSFAFGLSLTLYVLTAKKGMCAIFGAFVVWVVLTEEVVCSIFKRLSTWVVLTEEVMSAFFNASAETHYQGDCVCPPRAVPSC